MRQHFRLFVYGTLRLGYANHARFCSEAIKIFPGKTFGKLYGLPYGYPGLICQPSLILAQGTSDPINDLKTQNEILNNPSDLTLPKNGFDWIFGEVVTLANPLLDIPPIDRLEGFQPGKDSLYNRVLIQALVEGEWVQVWTYEYARKNIGTYLPSGIWHG